MRIVIDTNVVASAIFFGGKPQQLIELLLEDKIEALVSSRIINEYNETVNYLKNKYPYKEVYIPLTQIVSAMRLITTTSEIHVCRDKDDDKFISCAVDGKCLYIVSGDKALLILKNYGDVEIITVSEFFERYK